MSRARFSLSTTTISSPASGTASRPWISTGTDGPASLTWAPLSSVIARTRPQAAPATTMSPCLQRAALHEHGGDHAATAIEPRLDDRTPGLAVGIGLELEQLGLQLQLLEQRVEPGALQGADRHGQDVAAEILDHDVVAQQLLLDPVGVGLGVVHLVDGDDDRRLRRLGVLDRLDGLRHDAVIGGDHQHHDVGDRGAAGAHLGEGGVTRRVDEGDRQAGRRHSPDRRRYAG